MFFLLRCAVLGETLSQCESKQRALHCCTVQNLDTSMASNMIYHVCIPFSIWFMRWTIKQIKVQNQIYNDFHRESSCLMLFACLEHPKSNALRSVYSLEHVPA